MSSWIGDRFSFLKTFSTSAGGLNQPTLLLSLRSLVTVCESSRWVSFPTWTWTRWETAVALAVIASGLRREFHHAMSSLTCLSTSSRCHMCRACNDFSSYVCFSLSQIKQVPTMYSQHFSRPGDRDDDRDAWREAGLTSAELAIKREPAFSRKRREVRFGSPERVDLTLSGPIVPSVIDPPASTAPLQPASLQLAPPGPALVPRTQSYVAPDQPAMVPAQSSLQSTHTVAPRTTAALHHHQPVGGALRQLQPAALPAAGIKTQVQVPTRPPVSRLWFKQRTLILHPRMYRSECIVPRVHQRESMQLPAFLLWMLPRQNIKCVIAANVSLPWKWEHFYPRALSQLLNTGRLRLNLNPLDLVCWVDSWPFDKTW